MSATSGPLLGASRLEGGGDPVGCVSTRTLNHADWLSRCPRHQRCTVAMKVTDAARPQRPIALVVHHEEDRPALLEDHSRRVVRSLSPDPTRGPAWVNQPETPRDWERVRVLLSRLGLATTDCHRFRTRLEEGRVRRHRRTDRILEQSDDCI